MGEQIGGDNSQCVRGGHLKDWGRSGSRFKVHSLSRSLSLSLSQFFPFPSLGFFFFLLALSPTLSNIIRCQPGCGSSHSAGVGCTCQRRVCMCVCVFLSSRSAFSILCAVSLLNNYWYWLFSFHWTSYFWMLDILPYLHCVFVNLFVFFGTTNLLWILCFLRLHFIYNWFWWDWQIVLKCYCGKKNCPRNVYNLSPLCKLLSLFLSGSVFVPVLGSS